VRFSRLLSRRTTVAVVAVAATAAVTVPAGASTTTTTTPSHGSATSTLTLLELHLLGQSITAGRIAMVAANDALPHTAQLVITPLSSSATGPVGQQTVTPGTSATTVPGTPRSITLPNGLGKVTGPTFAVQAKDGAGAVLAAAKLSALGSINLTQLPLSLSLNAASLSDTAEVVSQSASGVKTFSLGNLSLPSVAALLDALGVRPVATLDQMTQGNLTKLAGVVTDATTGAVGAANSNVDTIQAQLSSPAQSVAAANSELSSAENDVTQANTAFGTAWSSAYSAATTAGTSGLVDTALSTAGVSNPPSADQFNALQPADVAALQPIFDVIDSTLWTTLTQDATAVDAAEQVVTLVNQLVDSLQALVQAVLGAIDADTDPIASLGGLSVQTKAVAAKAPSANAAVKVATVNVLGLTKTLSSLTQALTAQLQPLTQALNSVAGISFTPPKIAVGVPTHGTSTSGATRSAHAGVSAVTVTLPTITLPSALHVAGVPAAVSGSLRVGVLAEKATWTPSVSQTVTTPDQQPPTTGNGPQLSDTGGRIALPIVAVVVLAAAAVLRRRWGHA
jgi:hypothetical protein